MSCYWLVFCWWVVCWILLVILRRCVVLFVVCWGFCFWWGIVISWCCNCLIRVMVVLNMIIVLCCSLVGWFWLSLRVIGSCCSWLVMNIFISGMCGGCGLLSFVFMIMGRWWLLKVFGLLRELLVILILVCYCWWGVWIGWFCLRIWGRSFLVCWWY